MTFGAHDDEPDNAARRALLDAVARVTAGCGRDSPTGLALVALIQDVEVLAGRTRTWAGEPDLFLWFVEQLADLCVRHAQISATLRSSAPGALAPLRHMIVEAGGRALPAAQAQGLVRGDLQADDILTIASLLGAGLEGDLGSRRAVSLSARSIILDGLKARS